MMIAHAIGWLGTACYIFSYQCKSSRKLVFCQVVGGLLYVIHYLMLGAVSGAATQSIAIFANFLVCCGGRKWADWPGWRWLLSGIFVVSLFFTWQGLRSLLPCVASVVNTYVRFSRNGKRIRLACLFVSSPCWLAFNALTHSWSGVFCEAFTIGSVFVSIARYGMKALDQKD